MRIHEVPAPKDGSAPRCWDCGSAGVLIEGETHEGYELYHCQLSEAYRFYARVSRLEETQEVEYDKFGNVIEDNNINQNE